MRSKECGISSSPAPKFSGTHHVLVGVAEHGAERVRRSVGARGRGLLPSIEAHLVRGQLVGVRGAVVAAVEHVQPEHQEGDTLKRKRFTVYK